MVVVVVVVFITAVAVVAVFVAVFLFIRCVSPLESSVVVEESGYGLHDKSSEVKSHLELLMLFFVVLDACIILKSVFCLYSSIFLVKTHHNTLWYVH